MPIGSRSVFVQKIYPYPYHTRPDTPLVLTQSSQTLSKLLASDQKSHVISSHYRKEWFEKELLPNTPKNSVIVLDNATFHKREDALLEIQQQGHTLEFLPPYSPNLNPIENKWAQAKSIRRKFGYTPEELFIHTDL